MKKIGILTYFKEYTNLGTNMQSYCTLKAIQKGFPEAHIELINYSEWRKTKKPYFSNISIKSFRHDLKRFKKYDSFFQNELLLSTEKLVSPNVEEAIKFIKRQNYHSIFVGSDTVLELRRAPKNKLTIYWLDNSIDCYKFLIAASSHSLVYNKLSDIQKNLIHNTIPAFSLLGVRDEPTFRLLRNFISTSDKRLEIVPDPTFLLDIDYTKIEEYLKRQSATFSNPTVCLHLLRDSNWASALANLFRKSGFAIASFRPAYYADIILNDLSPHEQIGIYKYFALVITHRFHDTIFCLKNLTPVIFFPEHATDVTEYNESKSLTIFKLFNLEKTNYIENKHKITAKYIIDIHKEAISTFRDNENHIKKTIEDQRHNYELFVEKARKICMP